MVMQGNVYLHNTSGEGFCKSFSKSRKTFSVQYRAGKRSSSLIFSPVFSLSFPRFQVIFIFSSVLKCLPQAHPDFSLVAFQLRGSCKDLCINILVCSVYIQELLEDQLFF